MTSNRAPPPWSTTMDPGEEIPSPQSMVAVKSSIVLNGLGSLNRATTVVMLSPVVVSMLVPVDDRGASATFLRQDRRADRARVGCQTAPPWRSHPDGGR